MLRNEPARLDLFSGLEQVLGEERATTLMTYLPSTSEVASHEDIRRLERRMDERFAWMDQRFTQMDQRFTQMDQRFAELVEGLDRRFTESERRMDEQMRERIESVRETVNERYRSLEHQISRGDASTATALHQEMGRLITSQTRIIVFAFVGSLATIVSLFLLGS